MGDSRSTEAQAYRRPGYNWDFRPSGALIQLPGNQPGSPQPDACAVPSSQELISWLDREVKSRLQVIDAKLEQSLHLAASRLRNGRLRPPLRGTTQSPSSPLGDRALSSLNRRHTSVMSSVSAAGCASTNSSQVMHQATRPGDATHENEGPMKRNTKDRSARNLEPEPSNLGPEAATRTWVYRGTVMLGAGANEKPSKFGIPDEEPQSHSDGGESPPHPVEVAGMSHFLGDGARHDVVLSTFIGIRPSDADGDESGKASLNFADMEVHTDTEAGDADGEDTAEKDPPEGGAPPKSGHRVVFDAHTMSKRRSSLLHLTTWLQKRTDQQHWLAEHIWAFLEDHESSRAAAFYWKAAPAFILLSVIVTLLQCTGDLALNGPPVAALEMAIEGLFVVEVGMRFVACPTKQVFFVGFFNLIDMASCLPILVRIFQGFVLSPDDTHSFKFAVLLGAVPVLRLFKVLRFFQKFFLLIKAFKMAFEALPVIMFIYVQLILIFSILIYMVEYPANEDIYDLPQAAWLTVVSMTTMGYGDITPQTPQGKLLVCILVITSTLYTSIPLGIIGDAFSEVWRHRDRILLTRRTRNRLIQWGYRAHDIPKLFHLFDLNRDGELDIEEFRHMVGEMKLGLKDQRVIELFELFDNDGSGFIDDREFVKGLFPENYHDVYFRDDGQQVRDDDDDDEEEDKEETETQQGGAGDTASHLEESS